MRNETLRVEGMACEACASTVETALKGVSGVREADIVLDRGEARLVLDDNVREEDLLAAVERAGFGASVQD